MPRKPLVTSDWKSGIGYQEMVVTRNERLNEHGWKNLFLHFEPNQHTFFFMRNNFTAVTNCLRSPWFLQSTKNYLLTLKFVALKWNGVFNEGKNRNIYWLFWNWNFVHAAILDQVTLCSWFLNERAFVWWIYIVVPVWRHTIQNGAYQEIASTCL